MARYRLALGLASPPRALADGKKAGDGSVRELRSIPNGDAWSPPWIRVNALIARKDEDEVRQELVDHSINHLRFGERPVFVCPLTGAPPAAGQRPGADLLYVSEGWQAI